MAEIHTGAMIALIPTLADVQRLHHPGGLVESELHATVAFLGEAADIQGDVKASIAERCRQVAAALAPVTADGFAIDIFNPDGEDPCIVLGLSGDAIAAAHDMVMAAVGDLAPAQRVPWIPHVTLLYTRDFDLAAGLVDRVGPVTFDRLRVAFGGDHIDFPLTGPQLSQPGLDPLQLGDVVARPLPEGVYLQASGEGVGAPHQPEHLATAEEAVLVADTATTLTAAVNASGWSKLPVADRDTKFAFRAAVDRLAAHADSVEQFSSWFFWRDPSKPANNRNSYRLPFADVFGDAVKLVPAAVFSAAAQMAGAHGGAPSIIPPAEREQIMRIIDRIYDQFRADWDDPRQIPPWERESNSVADEPVKAAITSEEEEMPIDLVDDMPALVAAAGAFLPPAAAFRDPGFTGPTKPRITDMGSYQLYQGHIAQWNVCHRGMKESCVLAPRSRNSYADFQTGTVLTADGQLLPVGKITMDTGHAAHSLSMQATVAHYDDTGLAAVVAAVGEDPFGIWASGVVIPGTDPGKVFTLRASAISGDWRWNSATGSLELVAALAVNTPGFPIHEPQYALAASGEQLSLTAAGVVHDDDCGCDEVKPAVTVDTVQRVAALEAQAAKLIRSADGRRQRKLLDMQLPVRS